MLKLLLHQLPNMQEGYLSIQQQVPCTAMDIHIYSHYVNQPLRVDRMFSAHTMLELNSRG